MRRGVALLALALARAARRPATRARVVARDDDATTKIERSSVARDEVTMTIGAHGDVRLRLRPDWHAESAAYVAALAAERGRVRRTRARCTAWSPDF